MNVPVELHAFNYWATNYGAWSDDLLDVGHEYGTYALNHWHHVRSDSSVHLALTAFSLAVFGRARRVNSALEIAGKFYTRSIIKTQREINQISSDTVEQLLIATTLMASYDVRIISTVSSFLVC